MFQALRRSMKWIIIVVVVAFSATLLYVGGVDLFGSGGSAELDLTVAEVNGRRLQAAQLNSQVAYRVDLLQSQGVRVSGLQRETIRHDALQDLIVQSLLQQAADEMRISVDSAEVAQSLDAIRAQFPSNESYRQALRQSGLNEAMLRDQLRESLRLQAVREQVTGDVQVTDEEVARAYEAVHVRQLIVLARGEEEAWAAAEARAAQLRQRLVEGSSFEEVVAAADDPDVVQNDLGFVTRNSTLPQELIDAAFQLAEGEFSPPIRTSTGYRVVQAVEWRRAEGEEFEEQAPGLREQLLAQKQQEAYRAWLEERRSQAEITIIDPALRAMDRLAAGDLEGAESAFRQAIAADPQNAYLHGLLAQILARQEKLDEAVMAAEQAVSLFDRDPELYMLLGNLLREAERPDEAVASYQKASELSPYDMQLHLTLFSTYLDMGREEEAEAERARLQEIQELLQERERAQQEMLQRLQGQEAEETPDQGQAEGGAEAGSDGSEEVTPPADH